jgi:hypothetical protein
MFRHVILIVLPSKVAQTVMLLACILEVPCPNLSLYIDSSSRGVPMFFFIPSRVMPEWILKCGYYYLTGIS